MERIPKGEYTKEFREEAVKLATDWRFRLLPPISGPGRPMGQSDCGTIWPVTFGLMFSG